ncbi:hypothetical protein ACHAQA_001476 [Verticillium albo-atrum]
MICRLCQRAIAHTKPSPSHLRAAPALRALSTTTTSPIAIAATSPRHPARLAPAAARLYSQAATPAATTAAASAASPKTPALEKPDYLDEAETWIWDTLVAEFAPLELVVRDVSGGCGSMYSIDITSAQFRGANMLKQQRMVNKVLGDKVKQWHGVQLRTKAP